MGCYILKATEHVNVTVDESGFYTIRLNKYVGATFTLDINGNISIGQSSRITYDYDDFKILEKEIEEGQVFMRRAKLAGGVQRKKDKVATIKPSQIKPFTIYKDEKGRFIFYLGEGVYEDINSMIQPRNRLNCNFIYGICRNERVLSDGSFIADANSGCIVLTNDRNSFDIDSYSGKPRGLVKEIISYDGVCDKIMIKNVNGLVLQHYRIRHFSIRQGKKIGRIV